MEWECSRSCQASGIGKVQGTEIYVEEYRQVEHRPRNTPGIDMAQGHSRDVHGLAGSFMAYADLCEGKQETEAVCSSIEKRTGFNHEE